MPAPEGFTESEWAALGSHTCPRDPRSCTCRVHYGVDQDTTWTGLRIVKTPEPPKINRNPARQPWVPRPPRHLRRAA
jgi:hypothetical protein